MENNGRFKKGEHWRQNKPHWDKDWLIQKYVTEGLSTVEIAEISGCRHTNISYWMKKHGIKGRTISDARKIKYWGQSGESNPMYGKNGILNQNWKGGITPERQSFYISSEWKNAVKEVFVRDNYLCVNCGETHRDKKHPLHIHHIVSFQIKSLRTNVNNLILLCKDCHNWVHSKQNTNKQYILTYEQYRKIQK